MQIFWLKRNLRLQDSEPFFLSLKCWRAFGRVLPLYIHEPGLIAQPDVSRQHQAFVQETLDELATELRDLGGQLLQMVGESLAVLDRLHQCQPITRIWTHRETTQRNQYQRDQKVRAWCRVHGVELMEVEQNGIARGAQPCISFPDYFSKSVNLTLRDPTGAKLAARFAPLPFPGCEAHDIPLADGADKPLRQKGGRAAAIRVLDSFFNVRNINRYPFQISSPNTAWAGCARISTYLAYGILSDREVFQAVDRVVTSGQQTLDAQGFQRLQERARFFLDRLCWRRQYIQSFETRPELEYQCLLPQFNGVREATFDERLFKAWQSGHTGVPYIDAAMRCLHQTGWINMRLRATVVSFATMNLWLPTPRVAQCLATEFLDYEPALHHVIHQIVAGTTNFDGLMVYDPVKQGQDHDPDGQFIRRWVPELSGLTGPQVHDLSITAGQLSRAAERLGFAPYSQAIVDCRMTAKVAKRRIHAIKHGLPDPGFTDAAAAEVEQQMRLI
ncbi:MAG: FAD-binding domain-containing protein [Marinobacter sp.]